LLATSRIKVLLSNLLNSFENGKQTVSGLFFDERVGQNKIEIFTYDPGVTLSGADERSQPQQLPETQLDTQPEQ